MIFYACFTTRFAKTSDFDQFYKHLPWYSIIVDDQKGNENSTNVSSDEKSIAASSHEDFEESLTSYKGNV